jgi:NAD(P)-dependent dehydrogenase (short-subunit alcohol dehydrogenase family)
MDLHLEGKRALVTGGSAGIGYAVAEALSEAGCSLTLVARDASRLAAAAAELERRFGRPVATHASDVGDDAAHAEIAERHPDIDILVNNAGAIPGGSIDQIDQARFRTSWDLKVFGFVGMTREYYRRMRERGSGVIVNVIGASDLRGDPVYIAGSMGNASLTAMTKALGAEAPDFGVRVVAVSPGAVFTARQEGVLRRQAEIQFGDAERWLDFVKTFPFARMAKPEEVADTVAFLASPRAGYISGTIVNVDGGMSQRHKWWPNPRG